MPKTRLASKLAAIIKEALFKKEPPLVKKNGVLAWL
jgi:hypothetical protein